MRTSLRDRSAGAVARPVLALAALVMLGYLVVLIHAPQVREGLPSALRWFGRPNSAATIAIVVTVLIVLALLVYRSGGIKRPGAPVAIVGVLALMCVVMGVVSYWGCHDASHPRFFTTLMWTAELVKGGTSDRSLADGVCPSPTPVALEIARLSGLAAVFLSIFGVATALFQARLDKLRVFLARKVTAVVDIDDDAEPMVAAIAATLGARSTLVVITDAPGRVCVDKARNHGARVLTVDFGRPETLTSLPMWAKLDRLYLLAPDPATNLTRLDAISAQARDSAQRERIPLIVRIDDPWQAAAWRAQHFGNSDTRWAADAVGMYEVTARRLLDVVTAGRAVQRIVICGASQLTLALCADMTQRRIERDYHCAPTDPALPAMSVMAPNASDFKHDDEFCRRQLGFPDGLDSVEAIDALPEIPLLLSLIQDSGPPGAVAVILVDGGSSSSSDVRFGTRLAARTPRTPIFAWAPEAQVTERGVALVGRLRTYRLSLDLPAGQAQDAWERAARLIHDRYAAGSNRSTPATRPWSELDEFYRGSNRRQVHNALWMVEKIGGHSWNTWGERSHPPALQHRAQEPLAQLESMGFDRDTALAMARAEHEDWSRYYRRAGWRYGPQRDDDNKIHDKLVDWASIEADPRLSESSLSSLAATLTSLRDLGYRSRRVSDDGEWRSYRRIGSVRAEQHEQAWTWTAASGDTLHADAGDWEVRDLDGNSWSVRDDIFRSTYRHVAGDEYTRVGTVSARRARDGEIIATLEGAVAAPTGGWVLRGDHGDEWPMSADEFDRRYTGPLE